MTTFTNAVYADKLKEFRELCERGFSVSNSGARDSDPDSDIADRVAELRVREEQEEAAETKAASPRADTGIPHIRTLGDLIDAVRPVHVDGLDCGAALGAVYADQDEDQDRDQDRPTRDSIVWCTYALYSRDTKQLWVKRNDVQMERASANAVLFGVMLGMRFTPVGRLSCLVLPPEMLFGKLGGPPLIPPDAWGILLLRVHYYNDVSCIRRYASLEESQKTEFRVVKGHVESTNAAAKRFFEKGCYVEANEAYEVSLGMLEKCKPGSAEEKPALALLSSVYVNKALCYERMGKSRSFLQWLEKALALPEEATNRCKMYYWKGRHLHRSGKVEEGYLLLLEAQKLEPLNEEIAAELLIADKKVSENKEKLIEVSKKAIAINVEHEEKLSTTLTAEEIESCYESIKEIIESQSSQMITLPGNYTTKDYENLKYLMSLWNHKNPSRRFNVQSKQFQLRITAM